MAKFVIKGRILRYYWTCKYLDELKRTSWWIWSDPKIEKVTFSGEPITTYSWKEIWAGDSLSEFLTIGDSITFPDSKGEMIVTKILDKVQDLEGTIHYNVDYVLGEEDDQLSLERANRDLEEAIKINAERTKDQVVMIPNTSFATKKDIANDSWALRLWRRFF